MRPEFLEALQQTAVSSGKAWKRLIICSQKKKPVKIVKNMKIHEQLLNNKIKPAYSFR